MSKRIDFEVKWQSYEASQATNDPKDVEKLKLLVSESDVVEIFRRKESIADSVSDQSIPLPDSSSTDYLLISTDRQVSIKLNGGSEVFTLTPKTAGVKTPVFFWRGTITALSISNSSGNAANVDIISANV